MKATHGTFYHSSGRKAHSESDSNKIVSVSICLGRWSGSFKGCLNCKILPVHWNACCQKSPTMHCENQAASKLTMFPFLKHEIKYTNTGIQKKLNKGKSVI